MTIRWIFSLAPKTRFSFFSHWRSISTYVYKSSIFFLSWLIVDANKSHNQLNFTILRKCQTSEKRKNKHRIFDIVLYIQIFTVETKNLLKIFVYVKMIADDSMRTGLVIFDWIISGIFRHLVGDFFLWTYERMEKERHPKKNYAQTTMACSVTILFMLSKHNFIRIASFLSMMIFFITFCCCCTQEKWMRLKRVDRYQNLTRMKYWNIQTLQRFCHALLTWWESAPQAFHLTDWSTARIKKCIPLWWTNKHVHFHNQKSSK